MRIQNGRTEYRFRDGNVREEQYRLPGWPDEYFYPNKRSSTTGEKMTDQEYASCEEGVPVNVNDDIKSRAR
jgi:hypothetical protein